MEGVGVLSSSSLDVRHEPPLLPPISTSKPHKPLRPTSSLRPEFLSSPNIRPNIAGSSRHMISSPLRTFSPVTARASTLPPIDTTNTSPTLSGSQPLERVPTEPASAPPPRQQPSADELAVLSIKVRDFALEPSTLPPVPTVRRMFPLLRDLKRQREETPEETEAKKRNEEQRLEFNSLKIRDETSEEQEPRRLMMSSPRINSSLDSGFSRIPRLAEGSFMRQFELPDFDGASTNSSPGFNANTSAGPRWSPGSSPRAGTPLQRHPSERYIPSFSPSRSSMLPSTGGLFANLHHSSPSPSRRLPPLRVSNGDNRQSHNPFPFLSNPQSALEWISQLLGDSQSESQPESQVESQSQGAGSSQCTLPGLTISQTDSEMSDLDDEEYVKTPLVTPNGSLIFDDDDHPDSITLDRSDAETIGPTSDNAEMPDNNDTPESVGTGGDDSIIDSSTLPESQVAELLAPVETGPEGDVTASQMGLCESQDLLSSQPAWQQQSQSQAQHPSQLLFSQERETNRELSGVGVEDVEMPDSQLEEDGEDTGDHENRASTPTPTSRSPRSPFVRVPSSSSVSTSRPSASVCSNHSASSSQPRPLSRTGSSTLTAMSKTPRRSSRSLGRCSSSLSGGVIGLSRRASLPSLTTKGKRKLSNSDPTTSLNASAISGKSRYNLRTPPQKKAKLLGLPSHISLSMPRVRSRSNSAPNGKKGTSPTSANGRRSRSATQTRRRRSSGKGVVNVDADVVMKDESCGVGGEVAS